MKMSRTENAVRNIEISIISQIITFAMVFINRTVLIRYLSIDYMGINGLFSNIFSVLNFVELGIGNAVIFSLYKPMANKEYGKIASFLEFYKRAYIVIQRIILVGGIAVIPFLGVLIKGTINIKENIVFLYLLFLINTVVSFCYIFKQAILIVDQKNYQIILFQQFFKVISLVLQIILLIYTKSYIIYVIIQILNTFITNFIIGKYAEKKYEIIFTCKNKHIDKYEKEEINESIRAIALYKFGSVILNSTDNIIISILFGISVVGINSNYFFVISNLSSLLNHVFSTLTASVGNLNAVGTVEKKLSIFRELLFISEWIYGYISIMLMLFINQFINMWIGKDFVLSNSVVAALVFVFYLEGVQFPVYTYRVTLGLFKKGKLSVVVGGILNIILSFIFGIELGLVGIFIATIISRMLTLCWVDPYLIYKYEFKKSVIGYFQDVTKYFIVIVIGYLICSILINPINIVKWEQLFYYCAISTIVINGYFWIIGKRTNEFIELKKLLQRIILKRRYNKCD